MFKAIVRFSIRKKLFVALTTLFLLIGGIWSMLTLPVDAVPDITNNQVQIVTVSPTLAPQEVEQLITMPVEIAMSNIMNVTEIRSVSRFGLSLVTVVFKESVPTLVARQLINEQIQVVAGEIPPELGTPEMMPITTGLGEIYQYVLRVDEKHRKDYDAMELRTIQDWIGLSSDSCRVFRVLSKSTVLEAISSSMRWPSTPMRLLHCRLQLGMYLNHCQGTTRILEAVTSRRWAGPIIYVPRE